VAVHILSHIFRFSNNAISSYILPCPCNMLCPFFERNRLRPAPQEVLHCCFMTYSCRETGSHFQLSISRSLVVVRNVDIARICIRSFFMIRMFYCLPAKVTSLFSSDFIFRSRSGLLCFGKIQNKKNSIFGSISVLNLDYFQITNKSQLIAYSFIQISL